MAQCAAITLSAHLCGHNGVVVGLPFPTLETLSSAPCGALPGQCCVCGHLSLQAAADALARIFPSVVASGHMLSIPMPGHAPSGAVHEERMKEVRMEGCLVARCIWGGAWAVVWQGRGQT